MQVELSTLPGAKHLYLLDFDETNLPDLKQAIEGKYPDVKARLHSRNPSINLG